LASKEVRVIDEGDGSIGITKEEGTFIYTAANDHRVGFFDRSFGFNGRFLVFGQV
jgi:hypothetical protein